jgi:hypothetical protein
VDESHDDRESVHIGPPSGPLFTCLMGRRGTRAALCSPSCLTAIRPRLEVDVARLGNGSYRAHNRPEGNRLIVVRNQSHLHTDRNVIRQVLPKVVEPA